MSRFYVSQDETGYFQLSYEDDQGNLSLRAHQYDSATQLIEEAIAMAESGKYGHAIVVVDPIKPPAAAAAARAAGDSDYKMPAPRRVGV
jgi:hypothetical protein